MLWSFRDRPGTSLPTPPGRSRQCLDTNGTGVYREATPCAPRQVLHKMRRGRVAPIKWTTQDSFPNFQWTGRSVFASSNARQNWKNRQTLFLMLRPSGRKRSWTNWRRMTKTWTGHKVNLSWEYLPHWGSGMKSVMRGAFLVATLAILTTTIKAWSMARWRRVASSGSSHHKTLRIMT